MFPSVVMVAVFALLAVLSVIAVKRLATVYQLKELLDHV